MTGSVSKIPGVAPGTRAAALPDSGVELPSGFLTTFGRPARESACECERSSGMQLGPVMALVSGPTLADALADPSNELTRLVSTQGDDIKLIDELFLRILNRKATPAEVETCRKDMQAVEEDHRRMAEELGRDETEFAIKRPEIERTAHGRHRRRPRPRWPPTRRSWLPDSPNRRRRRPRATAKLEADLKTYETTTLAKKMADWEKAQCRVDRQPMGRPRAQDHQRHQPVGPDQGARRLDHRSRAATRTGSSRSSPRPS